MPTTFTLSFGSGLSQSEINKVILKLKAKNQEAGFDGRIVLRISLGERDKGLLPKEEEGRLRHFMDVVKSHNIAVDNLEVKESRKHQDPYQRIKAICSDAKYTPEVVPQPPPRPTKSKINAGREVRSMLTEVPQQLQATRRKFIDEYFQRMQSGTLYLPDPKVSGKYVQVEALTLQEKQFIERYRANALEQVKLTENPTVIALGLQEARDEILIELSRAKGSEDRYCPWLCGISSGHTDTKGVHSAARALVMGVSNPEQGLALLHEHAAVAENNKAQITVLEEMLVLLKSDALTAPDLRDNWVKVEKGKKAQRVLEKMIEAAKGAMSPGAPQIKHALAKVLRTEKMPLDDPLARALNEVVKDPTAYKEKMEANSPVLLRQAISSPVSAMELKSGVGTDGGFDRTQMSKILEGLIEKARAGQLMLFDQPVKDLSKEKKGRGGTKKMSPLMVLEALRQNLSSTRGESAINATEFRRWLHFIVNDTAEQQSDWGKSWCEDLCTISKALHGQPLPIVGKKEPHPFSQLILAVMFKPDELAAANGIKLESKASAKPK